MKITEKHVLFWGGIFSNWATVPNKIKYTADNGIDYEFSSSEHLFMFLKAQFFGDMDTAEMIAKAESPKEAKRLGRLVKNFNEITWSRVREHFMLKAIELKAISYPLFSEELTKDEYEDKTFVEASPYDKIWGIGIPEEDSDADDETKWKGLNLLGKALTQLRDSLI